MEMHESQAVGNRVIRLGHYAKLIAQAAGARPEMAAAAGNDRARALTWYAAGIGAIEAAGAAVAALLPVGANGAPEGVLLVVVVAQLRALARPDARRCATCTGQAPPGAARGHPRARHAGALTEHSPSPRWPRLLPCWVWRSRRSCTGARGSRRRRSGSDRRARRAARCGPALGTRACRRLAGARRAPDRRVDLAAASPAGLLVAQCASGLAPSALNGLFDARVASGEDDTAALGWAASARSLAGQSASRPSRR